LLAVALSAPASAQTSRPSSTSQVPDISWRPFFLLSAQRFSAETTIDAVFQGPTQPFFGGGLQVAWKEGFFAEVAFSRFKKDGERAFINNGQVFRLGIPLTATITPIEFGGGYRFGDARSSIRPYAGAGFGTYGYSETSHFSASGEDVDVRHGGFYLHGGAEFRVHPWIGLSADVQYTHVPGILGESGLSQVANESDLGGVAARFRVMVGR
jgi:hypothetical protein